MRLTGTCNRCGLCCYSEGLRCINLIVAGEVGKPFATRCGAYSVRYDGMPIVMLDENGQEAGDFVCSKGTPAETQAIVERGIGRGCSMIFDGG